VIHRDPKHPNRTAYVREGNAVKVSYPCPCHGEQFESRPILRAHMRAFRGRIRKDFAEMVRTGTLMQVAWERLPGETPLMYKRFQAYLNGVGATGKRSVERTAKVMATNPVQLRMIASKWHWALRADLWDRHIEAEEFRQFEVEKRQSARKQARLGQKLQEVAMAGASAILMDQDRVAEMSGNEIAKLADVGTKIERLANSDPTAISEDRGQVKLVWDGPQPAWAPKTVEAEVIDRGPLTQRVLGGGDA